MSTASELARSGPLAAPRICCLDLDTFFVSVERVLDPTLEGKPVVVGGRPGSRGVVTAASYEVRRLGVKSGMSLIEAGKLAPDAIYLPTRGDTYGDYAERVREIARRYSPVVVVASIDEMFLDFSGCERLYARPGDEGADAAIERAVLELAAAIDEELGLPASAGLATSKVMAKVASSLAKPRGVMLVPAGVERAVLAPLPVRSFPGIGPVAESKLHAAGYETLGAIAEAPLAELRRIFGAWAPSIQRGVQGRGLGRARARAPGVLGARSRGRDGRQHLQRADLPGGRLAIPPPSNRSCAACASGSAGARASAQVKARTVTLKLRYADFHTLTRSRTLAPTSSELELYPVLKEMLAAARTRPLPVRLLGVQLSNLGVFEQLSLFDHHERAAAVVDRIRERYGFSMVTLATQLGGAGKTPAGFEGARHRKHVHD